MRQAAKTTMGGIWKKASDTTKQIISLLTPNPFVAIIARIPRAELLPVRHGAVRQSDFAA